MPATDWNLDGKRVAILATHGFEQSELEEPKRALEEAGAKVDVVAPEGGEIRGWRGDDWGDPVAVDCTLAECSAKDYDGLVLPGGVINPDLLRVEPAALDLIRAFESAGKTVAAICHAPWLLAEADLLRERKATSYHSIKTDVVNAGAEWVDEPAVTDKKVVTSRNPDDLEAFCDAAIRQIAERPDKILSA